MSIKDIQGLRFTKDGLTFKASQIKRDLTFANIVLYLDENAKKGQEAKTTYQQQARQNNQPRQEPNPRQEERQEESYQASLHWVCSTPTTPSMTPKMKISAVVCNRRRKRNEGQDYSL